MFPLNTATWICIALLTPFWWALSLMTLALIGDVWPRWRIDVSHLFDLLERARAEEPKSSTIPKASPRPFAA